MSDRKNKALNNSIDMLGTLRSWAQAGWIRWLDAELAEFLYQEARPGKLEPSPLLLLGAALCSHQNGHGHLCLDLRHCLQSPDKTLLLPPEHALHTPEITPGALLSSITLSQWASAFAHPLLCSHESAPSEVDGYDSDRSNTPLVLYSDHLNARLYLRRYWHYECQLKKTIQQKLQTVVSVDEAELKQVLNGLFEDDKNSAPNWQKIACALSVRSQFAIITGGPGTGKTTTVVKLLSLLQSLNKKTGESSALRIKLAAPTGKAAARLSASIAAQLPDLPDNDAIPREVSTVHRLLGPVRHSRFFRHNAANPLPADVVVVDEASMVDVELMAQLMDALPAHCRLILLGDKDQLASVEAGAVLGSLCAKANGGHYHSDTADWVARVSAQTIPNEYIDSSGRQLDQAITTLRYSHRFGAVPGIGALAEAVNRGANGAGIQALFTGRHAELNWIKARSSRDPAFENLLSDKHNGYGNYLTLVQLPPASGAASIEWDNWADRILTAHTAFQLLAALRKGEFGVEELNTRIKNILISRGLIHELQKTDQTEQDLAEWYAGRPVMVTRNNYNLELMNGDIGVTLPYPNVLARGGFSLRVAFRDTRHPGQIRWILPTRLQDVETVFAMTVHKSQGSEFSHTALILPTHDSPILTRELIYTGITRASRQFTLVCSESSILQQAVQARVFRAGGLEDSLA
ncbi:MAG: exodeoxyribonuclease V subunit alpha [Pseudohongiella sp.]|nr:exodeoxyribonuclease V subunit alpha [Pseudohongiella sp.]